MVIPFKIPDYPTVLPLYSWRLFLALGSLPGFLAGIWVLYLPESPRLLMDTNRGDKALKIMAHIHKIHHGKNVQFKVSV